MAKVSDTVEIELGPDDAFTCVSDLSRYEDWLTIHDGWRSPLPAEDEIGKGTSVDSVIKVKGTRVRFAWTVTTFDPPRRVELKGSGKGGVKAELTLSVAPKDAGSTVTFEINLGGLALMGPAGKAAAKALQKDLRESLQKFHSVFS
ncbi:type II toxin-antitoxin system Rv0910 family toxin [Williamsia sterculiae]|uniref:Polyketide cyclase / dehydrase and lipid transport n=1 Tax=Williamsia sterculiae TaxID=1344003 RepID=A0A1N7DHD0_9NOCA|nr:SRPBCC family protein [Williamsia sterculiae]SIR75155.1 Polyketide cyclase / dehydrase and lipid transport [Williamsia sterculiae]